MFRRFYVNFTALDSADSVSFFYDRGSVCYQIRDTGTPWAANVNDAKII